MKFFAVGLILGLVIGGSFTFLSDSSPQRVQDIDHCTAIKPTQPEIIVQKDCTERTNEIDIQKIEKAFLLFLASIGIKKDYADSIKNLVQSPETFNPHLMNEQESKTDHDLVSTQFYYPKNEAIKKYNLQSTLRDLAYDEPQFRKNENFLLKDAAVYFAKSKTISSYREIKKYNGMYSGKFYRLTGKHKGKVEDVEMSIEFFEKDKDKIDGKFNMTIARDGVIYSNMRGDGGNNDLYLNPQNPEELIIKAAPGMYFQFLSKNFKNANVYDEGEFIGVSTLRKL